MKKIMFNDKYGLTKAVLEGRKTMTRRIVPELKGIDYDAQIVYDVKHDDFMAFRNDDDIEPKILLPYFKVGEVVAVAQSYKSIGRFTFSGDRIPGWGNKMFVQASLMPHQIRITNVRVERLKDISNEDCDKEGIVKFQEYPGVIPLYGFTEKGRKKSYINRRSAFSVLIDKVFGKGTWEANPYVFVYEFELVK